MKRTLTILLVAIISFVLGAGSMYLVKHPSKPPLSDGWITVKVTDFPIGYVLDYPVDTLRTPKATGLTGKVKFLRRDNGIQLGYVLKIPVEPVPTKSLPVMALSYSEYRPPNRTLQQVMTMRGKGQPRAPFRRQLRTLPNK